MILHSLSCLHRIASASPLSRCASFLNCVRKNGSPRPPHARAAVVPSTPTTRASQAKMLQKAFASAHPRNLHHRNSHACPARLCINIDSLRGRALTSLVRNHSVSCENLPPTSSLRATSPSPQLPSVAFHHHAGHSTVWCPPRSACHGSAAIRPPPLPLCEKAFVRTRPPASLQISGSHALQRILPTVENPGGIRCSTMVATRVEEDGHIGMHGMSELS